MGLALMGVVRRAKNKSVNDYRYTVGGTAPEMKRMDTKNEGPWKMYLQLEIWHHFVYQLVKVQGQGGNNYNGQT